MYGTGGAGAVLGLCGENRGSDWGSFLPLKPWLCSLFLPCMLLLICIPITGLQFCNKVHLERQFLNFLPIVFL